MIEQLFGSKTRVKLLQLFLANPGRSFYVRELTRKIDEQINSVRRELSNLMGIGIITSDSANNKLYYEVSASQKDFLKRLLATGAFDVIITSGRLVGQQGAEIDLILVGSCNKQKLEKLMKAVELEEGNPIRYTVIAESEFMYRLEIKDRFITTVLAGKHSVLTDESGLIKKTLKS